MVKDRILVGRFGAPHGVGGELRLNSFTGVPRAIASYKPLLDATGTRQFSIAALRPLKDGLFVARIAGVNDREGAKALTNVELYVPRQCLPTVEEEEFYLADLIGLSAMNETGEPIGKVVQVVNFGAGDILEIARADGGETLLLPFTKAIVPHVDLEAGKVTVVPPEEIEAKPSEA
ncbi:16S rRNA processing protein RimM [Beijerinckiaceae bacterium]|nr:16S rRNA processing protein RimM [Beijerinckiaceae bacterium]